VNYYIKHLVVDCQGNFSKATEWTILSGDPKIVCHPLIAMTMDIIWSRIAFRTFLHNKVWLLFEVIVFVVGVSAFEAEFNTGNERIIIASCRLFTYVFSMCPRIFSHVAQTIRAVRRHDTVTVLRHIPLPCYLKKWQEVVDVILMLVLVLCLGFEPILQCLARGGDFEGSGLFTQACPEVRALRKVYAVFALLGTFLFFRLTLDLAVFSTRVSAFVLICFRVVSEVALHLLGMTFVIAAFACGISALRVDNEFFATVPIAALSLVKMALWLFDPTQYDEVLEDPILALTVVFFLIVSMTFLLNLLIAQLSCAYHVVFQDMMGYARLNRAKVVVKCMPTIGKRRWQRFVDGLKLGQPCQFGPDDMGMPGAVQIKEPAAAHMVASDMILRFGGTTSPHAQWPEMEEDAGDSAEKDNYNRMEKMLDKALRRMQRPSGGRGGSAADSGSTSKRSATRSNEGSGSDAAGGSD